MGLFSFFVRDFPKGTTEGPGEQLDLFEDQKETGNADIADAFEAEKPEEDFDFDEEIEKMYKEGRTDKEWRNR